MTLPAKLGFGALALGSVGGLGYVGTRYFSNDAESGKVVDQPKPKTIKNLIDERYTHILLSTEVADDTHWTTNWGQYKTDNQEKPAGQDALKLPKWTLKNQIDLTAELKAKCASLGTSKDSSSYENVTKYCSRNVTIKDQAGKEKLVALDTQTDRNTNQNIWDKRLREKDSLQTHFGNLGVVFQDLDVPKIKAGCSGAVSKTKKESKYEAIFAAYKSVCTKKEGEE